MVIDKNKVVSFHYKLSEPGQEPFEVSPDKHPVVYLHGHQGVLPGLQDALKGKQVGDKVSVTLEPDQAYGQRRRDAIQRVSINHIVNPTKKKVKYQAGTIVYLNTKDGPQPAIVLKAGLKMLDVDINHPLAGHTLHFDIEVVSVRDATEEEITHGHVHGEGGVHH